MAERKAERLAFPGAPVLQPGGVVVVLDDLHRVEKQKETLVSPYSRACPAGPGPSRSVCQNTGGSGMVPASSVT